MADAKRDGNGVPTELGVLDSDGTTPQPLYVTRTGRLKVTFGGRGSGSNTGLASRDNNKVTTLLGTSSSDGVTPVPVYADSLGHLLVK